MTQWTKISVWQGDGSIFAQASTRKPVKEIRSNLLEASAVPQFVWVDVCAALRCRLHQWRLRTFQRCESTTILVYRTWILCFHVFWKLRSQAFSCCLQPSIKVWNEDENRPCTKLVLWPFIVQTKVMCFSDNKGVSEARKRSYLWSMMNMWDASS